MKVKFLGAAGTVTGSGYVLTAESGQTLLIDLGMFQGTQDIEALNRSELQVDIASLSGAILTHAHLDHCGRLPLLANEGFKADIWMTEPTRDLTELSLNDSAKVGKEDLGKDALYGKDQVKRIINKFKTTSYGKELNIGSFKIFLKDAGHILGSASLLIEDVSSTSQIKKIIFSGDLGNTPEALVMPTQHFASADAVVMESTYGDRTHPKENPADVLISEINAVEHANSALLIPAFSLERTQEILHIIAHAKRENRVSNQTPVFLDSPMAERATEIYEKYPGLFNAEVREEFKNNNPFDFPGLAIIMTHQDGQIIAQTFGPKVIIAGSGMMTGGRIVNHALAYLGEKSNRLLIVGYQGEGTLGRKVLEGEKQVEIKGINLDIRASINQTQAMSSHADQPRLVSWLKSISDIKKVILTHGENQSRSVLKDKIHQELTISDIQMPQLNDEITLE